MNVPRTVSRHGLVDLFCGCGGLSAGFLATGGFDHLFAADIDTWSTATYEKNLGHPAHTMDLSELLTNGRSERWARSIRDSTGGPIVLAGGPPCQGFSSHVKTRGDRHGRNPLVGVFANLAMTLRPDVVMLENVPDLVAERSWGVFTALRDTLVQGGYAVRARIINMAQLGVPQERFRLVLLATLSGNPTFPHVRRSRPSEFSTVREWIGHLPPVDSGETDPFDPMHEASTHRESTLEIIRRVPRDGGSRPPGVGPECLQTARKSYGGYTDVYGRLSWASPAPTMTARCRTPSCGRFVHPDQHRGLTAREAGLIQTFSDTWHFCGPFDDRYKQIGNAVPPAAATAFAEHILADFPTVTTEVGLFEVKDRPVGRSFSTLIPGIRRRGGVL